MNFLAWGRLAIAMHASLLYNDKCWKFWSTENRVTEVKLMPIIKSAIERVRTSEKAEARNASQLSQMRTAIKKFDKAMVAGADNLEDLYKAAISAIDRAHSKGLIKANKAARDKSRLSARYAKQ